MKRHFLKEWKKTGAKSLEGKVSQTVWKSGSEQDCRTLPTETVAGNAGFVYDWCRKHAMIHDKRMFAERAFYCLGQKNACRACILLFRTMECSYDAHSIAEKHRK